MIVKGILEAKGFLDSLVSSKLGLESKAGNNTAQLTSVALSLPQSLLPSDLRWER